MKIHSQDKLLYRKANLGISYQQTSRGITGARQNVTGFHSVFLLEVSIEFGTLLDITKSKLRRWVPHPK